MKNASFNSKELVKTTKSRRLTGVPVRSGVKAGQYSAHLKSGPAWSGPGAGPGGPGSAGGPGHPGQL